MSKYKQDFLETELLIKDKQYQDAINKMDIIIMLESQNLRAIMYKALCYEKMENIEKAIEFYILAYNIKQKEITVNNKLYELYLKQNRLDQAISHLQQSSELLRVSNNQQKYEDTLTKLIQAYQLKDDLQKCFDIFKVNISNQLLSEISRLKICTHYFTIAAAQDSIFIQVIQDFTNNFYKSEQLELIDENLKIILKYATKKKIGNEILQIIYEIFYKFEFSAIELLFQIIYIQYYHKQNQNFIVLLAQKCIQFLLGTQYLEEFKNEFPDNQYSKHYNKVYTDQDEKTQKLILEQNKFRKLLKIFLSFINIFNEQLLNEQYSKLLQILIKNFQIDVFTIVETDDFISDFYLVYPVQIYQEIKNYNDNKAKEILIFLNEKIKQKKDIFNVGYLEDFHTSLGLQVFDDIENLYHMKNICKMRLKVNQNNLEMLKCYFNCQQKIARAVRVYDEELGVKEVCQLVLTNEPDNLEYQCEMIWLEISNAENDKTQQFYLEKINLLEKIVSNIRIKNLQAKFKKRITLLKLTHKQYQNLEEILSLYQEICQLNSGDYQIYFGIGLLYYLIGNLKESSENLKRAFTFNQVDIHLNKMVFYIMIKNGEREDAYDFLDRIYARFQDVFWINQILGLYFIVIFFSQLYLYFYSEQQQI